MGNQQNVYSDPQGSAPSLDFITVAGDLTVDWMVFVPAIAAPAGLLATYQWELRDSARILAAPGGAALLKNLISAAVSEQVIDGSLKVTGASLPDGSLTDPSDDSLTRTYTTWRPYPVRADSPDLAWRMEAFLGLHPGTQSPAPPSDTTGFHGCLVIDDANLGFRSHEEAWPICLREGPAPQQVILKMSNPLATGPLWDLLSSRCSNALTVYCSVGDLRKEYAPIGQALSWERIARDIVQAVRSRDDLQQAARVIVSLGMNGAVIVERDGPAMLVYDPLHQEGDWESHRLGSPVGLGTCIAAGLALQAVDQPQEPDWPLAVSRGLCAARTLHERRMVRTKDEKRDDACFPLADVAARLVDSEDPSFRTVPVEDDADWTILNSIYGDGIGQFAERLVIERNATEHVDLPIERIGHWSSIDRIEIESMRSVRNIIREYLQQARPSRPLNLAVFGPPGSGKSFAIKQMTRQWSKGETGIEVLEFNLSQLHGPDDLPGALQQMRDCAVEGLLPLVFWDEFDSALNGREMGWLSQFLAPMQDGVFVENGVVRPIGPAIFIFAGGTHPSMGSFKTRAVELPGVKATDFLSRLRGYVDILGPNPASDTDRTWTLRRALLLRALLTSKTAALVHNGQIDVDPGVLQAFLGVTTYLHGARSMESIIDMSGLSGKLRYERSALPPRHQLALHVDPDEFLSLVDQGTLPV